MTKTIKAVAGCGTAGVTITIAGTSYWYINKASNSIKSKYSASLISKDASSNSIWEDRWNKLKLAGAKVSSENSKLKAAKTKQPNNTFTEEIKKLIQEGCYEIYDSDFVSVDSNNFKDFKEYCSLKLKDKTTGIISAVESDGRWTQRLDILKNYQKELISSFKAIKSKNTGATAQEVKQLCDQVKEEMFESEKDIKIVNFREFCSEITSP